MRKQLYTQLDPRAWPNNGLSPLNRIIAVVIVLSVLTAVLETEVTLRMTYSDWFRIANLIFGVLFTIEYVARLYAVGENPKYQGFLGRLRYVISPFALIDLAVILPFLLTLGGTDAYILRMVRLLRLICLAKLGRYSDAIQNVGRALYGRRHELIVGLFAAFVVMLFAATVLHFTEASHNPDSFGSIPRALWWGAATITKLGYGGAFPVTVLGKIFAVIFGIAAVGVVAMPIGILAASFSSAFQRERERGNAE